MKKEEDHRKLFNDERPGELNSYNEPSLPSLREGSSHLSLC